LEYWSTAVLGCWSVGVGVLVDPQTDHWSILCLMSTLPNVRDLLEGHITLELDSIDRLYLSKRLRAAAPTRPRIGRVPLPAPWTTDRLACAPGADHRKKDTPCMGVRSRELFRSRGKARRLTFLLPRGTGGLITPSIPVCRASCRK
jgi:hypothetical protein